MGQQQDRLCQQEHAPFQQTHASAGLAEIQERSYNIVGDAGREWHCFRAEDNALLETVGPGNDLLESLSYSPVRFDIAPTIDVERSQARYSNLVVHSSRSRTQRRSKDWEEWLHAAVDGRDVMLLSGFPEETPRPGKDGERIPCQLKRVPARYFLDRAFSKLAITPKDQLEDSRLPAYMLADNILVDNIQVICTATDFALFADAVETQLDDSERQRAILLQYVKDDTKKQRRRICFLEETVQAKDRFVQALTALWLEKRNESAQWF